MKNITVIIPNFNYGTLLERRIESIIHQTVIPSEIIFLDDCSTDDSLEVAEKYLSQSQIPWRIIKNDINQGVFRQWLKGIEIAQNDYIWICEADDYCELNFLETLMPAFGDENVVLAYCQSQFVDQSGDMICNYNNYISRYFNFSRWAEDYKSNGLEEIKNYLCCINTIPNASAVIFNKSRIDLERISPVGDYFNNGDWIFYILCLSSYPENQICYYHSPLNYFVRHQSSVFANNDCSTRPIVEFLNIMLYLLQNFSIGHEAKEVMMRSLIGNLIYWPIEPNLNTLVTPIMKYLPHENFHIIYGEETNQIISRLKHKLDISENRIQEQNLCIDNLKKTIEGHNTCQHIDIIKWKARLLFSSLMRVKKIFATILLR